MQVLRFKVFGSKRIPPVRPLVFVFKATRVENPVSSILTTAKILRLGEDFFFLFC